MISRRRHRYRVCCRPSFDGSVSVRGVPAVAGSARWRDIVSVEGALRRGQRGVQLQSSASDGTPGSAARPLHVAIFGAGPAGFFAAEELLHQTGRQVTVDLFDRLPTRTAWCALVSHPITSTPRTSSSSSRRPPRARGFASSATSPSAWTSPWRRCWRTMTSCCWRPVLRPIVISAFPVRTSRQPSRHCVRRLVQRPS